MCRKKNCIQLCVGRSKSRFQNLDQYWQGLEFRLEFREDIVLKNNRQDKPENYTILPNTLELWFQIR